MTGNLREKQYTFVIISCSILLNMRYVSDKSVKKILKCFMVNKFFFPPQIVPFEIMRKIL